jgi:hypothetical protein
MKLRWIFAFVLLCVPALALAQEDLSTLAGTYTYEGENADGISYSGSVTLTGSGPVYALSYVDDLGEAGIDEGSAVALAQGSIVASGFGEACGPATLLRQDDGVLFGMWHDSDHSAGTAIGMEYAIPQEATTGFAGTYDVVGTYADGAQYRATATISEAEDGSYEVIYQYSQDDKATESTPDEIGYGFAFGNVLGYTYGVEDGGCLPYILDVTDGAFTGYYIDDNGNVIVETGSKGE